MKQMVRHGNIEPAEGLSSGLLTGNGRLGLASPDGVIEVYLTTKGKLAYAVSVGGETIVRESKLAGRTQLWSQGANTGNSRHRQAFWLQYDLGNYQQGSIGVYCIQRAIHRAGDDRISSSVDQAEFAEGIFDCGWPSGSPFQTGETLGIWTQE